MSNWLYLALAIFSEVLATSFLKSSEGFTKLWPSIIVLIGYILAFYFLSLTLETMPIGIAYAIWSGVGVASITLVSIFAFDQKIDLSAVIGIGLIIIGVIVLRVFSDVAVD
ncbi:MAG: DMT family transporter [Candidatus Poseidoniaceae archaeon]